MAGFDDYLEASGAAKCTLTYTRGDTFRLPFIMRDARGARVPLTGYTGVFEVSQTEGGPVTHTGTVSLPADGDVVLTIDNLTARLLPVPGFYRVVLTAPDPGAEVKTILCGHLVENRIAVAASCGIGPDGQLTSPGIVIGCGGPDGKRCGAIGCGCGC